MTKRMKLEIDRVACCGYGICADICPEVYKLDQNNIVYEYDELVPVELEERAREGAVACPQDAVKILEVEE